MKINFEVPSNVIVASHITGIYDVNRSTVLANDDFSLVAEWAKSITELGLNGIIFHNNFSDETCKIHQNDFIHFVKVDYNPKYNPNVFRYAVYAEFLEISQNLIKNIFFTDISDVTVLKNPFTATLFLNNTNSIFCGDEPKILDNEWMQAHSENLRNKIADYADYELKFKDATLLNCGIIGGHISTILPLIEKLWAIHRDHNADNNSLYTGDMGAFNYLVRNQYNETVIHGYPVNTEFKAYKTDTSCWFKHK
ncbi:hypothetical protein [Pedobacter changchengzhani]|uniref:hypothetical protein n=1 Tax=Pedobacter changchengzhani TaxID=2529274 RepID=UPI001A9D834A|nr:hypothetical protein [Pedobacter changchengzhani]